MTRRRWGWKLAAILFLVVVAAGLFVAFKAPGAGPGKWLENASLIVSALALFQFGFGWPRLPRLLWRIFGPPFSIVMLFGVARAIGWIGTRMAIRPLTGPEEVGSAFVIVTLLGYALIIVIPLYRLAEWRYLRGNAQDEATAALQDTFA